VISDVGLGLTQARKAIFVPQERELLDRINLAHWETLFGSKLPWQIANGSHADEIEYMIYLQQNNKFKILSSPVGYLRSIHNSIPLNWKEEGLKKEQEVEKKRAEQICRQREEAKQAQTETSKKALYEQALIISIRCKHNLSVMPPLNLV